MINTQKFAKRLHKILDYYDLSAASFADEIHVGRSSISHILSGRNKPSLDFVIKTIKAFPEVEIHWLLNGTGSFPKGAAEISKTTSPPPTVPNPADFLKTKSTSVFPSEKPKVKRIVLFYENGSFEVYEN